MIHETNIKMYTINRNYGIGEIVEEDDKMITVYFEDVDLEKKLLKTLATTYATIEEAEKALNPEMTEEEVNIRIADMDEKKRIMYEGLSAERRLEEINAEMSKRLKRYI